jgi:peptidyl-tRNA hydrolase
MEIKYKQYVFLPKSLGMSVGKASSQVAHATFMALEKQRELGITTDVVVDEKLKCNGIVCDNYNLINMWKNNGMCVIVLQAKNTEHLTNISRYLDQWKIPNWLYIDEGLYGCDPMTPTALATGILTEDKHWMFEQFELFGKKDTAQDLIDKI